MPRLSSTQDRNTDPPRQDQRSAAIAAMGYRLASAGPRTRQRLIDRATAPVVTPSRLNAEPDMQGPTPAADRLPALASWDDTLWEQRLAAGAELGLARLSDRQGHFPVWRAVALLTSAACGFSLVLFGQSLHLGRQLHQANHQSAPSMVAEAQPNRPQPPPAAQPAPPPPPAAPRIQAAPRVATPAGPHAPATFAAAAGPPLVRTTPLMVLAMAAAPAGPKPHAAGHATSSRHELPRWLTEDRPEHERVLVMSPPPHNLDAPIAANTHPASSSALPPVPPPALIYAEAHSAPRPIYNSTPYYGPTAQTYGTYGALPPPTPY